MHKDTILRKLDVAILALGNSAPDSRIPLTEEHQAAIADQLMEIKQALEEQDKTND